MQGKGEQGQRREQGLEADREEWGENVNGGVELGCAG